MRCVALHFEFKADGGLGKSGPGDTLRLLHALRKRPASHILSVNGSKLLDGFVGHQTKIVSLPATSGEQLSGSVRDDVLIPILAQHCAEGDEVVHVFIGKEQTIPWSKIMVNLGDKNVTRQRIDSSQPKKGSDMFHAKWETPATGSPQSTTVAVHIRALQTQPELNTPAWFPEIVRRISAEMNWRILWLGGAKGPPDGITLDREEESLCYDGKTLRQQIIEARQRAVAGVGWNSGGLDIVAAAGLPILRIGEYQKCWCSRTKNSSHWGSRYNSFLAVATNIGLAPCSFIASAFPQHIVSTSLSTFLENASRLGSPAHVILPPGASLTADHLEADLKNYAIKWPTDTLNP